jgi:hypothetical protein
MTATFEAATKVFGGRSKGEVNILKNSRVRMDSRANGINRVIEGSPEIFHCIRGNIAERKRQISTLRLQFMDLVNSISLRLDEQFIGLAINKGLDASIEIADVRLCAGDSLPRARE